MAIYQATVFINAVSYVGSAVVSYQVDSNNTWDIGGGNEFAVSARGGATPSISGGHLSVATVSILAKSFFSTKSIKAKVSAIAQNYAPEDTLTLSVNEDGDWFATLGETFWSDIGQVSVYPGFRIVCGDGLAIINEDPQYHVRTVGVDIVSPFAAWEMFSEQWNLYIPLGTDFNRSVCSPNYFRKSDLLTAYFSDIQKYVTSESQYLTHRAGDLRKWNKIPADFLEPLLATLGSFLRLDMLDDEGRRRLAFEWIRFLLYAETRYFIDFLGYVYDTHFDIQALWTNDYRSFPGPGGPCNIGSQRGTLTLQDDGSYSCVLIDGTKGGGYYPTNHVAILYNLDDWNIDGDYEQKSLILDTFYKLASVPLVLEALSGHRKDTFEIVFAVADQTSHNYFSWAPPLVIASTTLYITMVDHRYIERSRSNN
jgi:hypothetical protein